MEQEREDIFSDIPQVSTDAIDISSLMPTISSLSTAPKYVAPKLADTVQKKEPKSLPPLTR